MNYISKYNDLSSASNWKSNQNMHLHQKQLDFIYELKQTNQFSFQHAYQQANNKCKKLMIEICDLDPDFQIQGIVTMYNTLGQFSIECKILKNGLVLRAKNRAMIQLMCRYLNRINASIKDGMFRIDTVTGQITFKELNIFTFHQYSVHIENSEVGITFIQQEIRTAVDNLRFNVYKVLMLMGELDYKISKYLFYMKKEFRDVDEDDGLQYKRKQIQKSITISHIEKQFMWSQAVKKCVKKQVQELNLIRRTIAQQEQIINNNKMEPAQVVDMLLMLAEEQKMECIQFSGFTTQKETEFAKFLAILVPKQGNDNNYIFQRIQVSNDIRWEWFDSGGFCKLEKARLNTVNYIQIPQSDFNYFKIEDIAGFSARNKKRWNEARLIAAKDKTLVKKTQTLEIDEDKIFHQKKILTNIMFDSCNYIGKFFYSMQDIQRKSLFSEYCPMLSLQHFKIRNKQSLSILTKLYILTQCCNSLRFLHDHQIIHLDVKPKNFLVAKNLSLKITDFGQSYCRYNCGPGYRPGFTVPYSPPEVYQQSRIDFSQKNDVFGFGVLMYEVIFEESLFHVNMVNKNKIKDWKHKNMPLKDSKIWSTLNNAQPIFINYKMLKIQSKLKTFLRLDFNHIKTIY